jgi:hypothetical protein
MSNYFRDPAQGGESSGQCTQAFQDEWMSSLEIESYKWAILRVLFCVPLNRHCTNVHMSCQIWTHQRWVIGSYSNVAR